MLVRKLWLFHFFIRWANFINLNFNNSSSTEYLPSINLKYLYYSSELLRAIYKEWFVLGLLDERNTTLEFYFFDFIRQTCEKFINCENFTSELQSNVRQWLLERLEDSKSPVLIKEKIIRLLPSFVTRREDISDFEMFR